MAKKLTVVVSQSQGKHPQKRQLEEEIATRLLMEPGVDVSLVPHLYDLQGDHTGLLFLRSVPGDVVVLGWMYPRAMRWTLARQGVLGKEGISLLVNEDEGEDEEKEGEERSQGIGVQNMPNRRMYCIDLRVSSKPAAYVDEVRRIVKENSQPVVELLSWIGGSPKPEQMERYLQNGDGGTSKNGGSAPVNGGTTSIPARGAEGAAAPGELQRFIDGATGRRWYPVIDYGRCTNCMECIDFCLFGVYGVDQLGQILVETQDNCKKGCPACSRVCPEHAIIFPEHKSAAIAGADGEVAELKIDLSKLFGGGEGDALSTAVAERDAELVKDGRDAVGMSVGMPKRQGAAKERSRDELDDLMDGLDKLDL